MFCQLPAPVFPDHAPDLFHAFYDKHPGIPKIVFCPISVPVQKRIVLCIKGIYGIQQAGQTVVEASTPDKGIPVGIRLYFCAVNKKLFQRDKALLLQTA